MAGRYPAAWLDELRRRTDLVQLVSSYVPLKKNGRRYWGLCPFHGEKTASFSVDAEQQLFYCFGCKAGGTAITFVMDMERLSFQEAVRYLADRQHIPLPEMEEDPDYQRKREQRERLLAANREAARFYHQLLFTPEGEKSLQYLKKRGLSDGVIRKFGLGASPDQWDSLTKHLLGEGFTLQELALAGLTIVRTASGEGETPGRTTSYDMFRERAIFPIIDQYGNVLAFGGRTISDRQPKYMNTADTPVFNKRLGVYAANLLRKERHLERVILVEGYMDVVSLTQYGVTGVCATLGTALTNEQARLLRRFAPKVYLAYDGDSAGQNAILKGLDILKAEGVPARVLVFPDGLDPDEFIRRDGLAAFESLRPLTPETYRMQRLQAQHDLSAPEGRTEYARACAEILQGLDPVEMETHVRELVVQTGFPRDVLMAQIAQGSLERRQQEQRADAAPPAAAVHPVLSAEAQGEAAQDQRGQETLLSLLATGKIPLDVADETDFDDPFLLGLYQAIAGGRSPAAIAEDQPTEALRSRVSRILITPLGEDTDQLLRMAQECLNSLRRQKLISQLDAITARIDQLAGPEKAAAIAEFQQLSRQLSELKSH